MFPEDIWNSEKFYNTTIVYLLVWVNFSSAGLYLALKIYVLFKPVTIYNDL